MTNQETNYHEGPVTRIIEEFLSSHPDPGEKEWMTLIEANPDFALDIVDAALLERGTRHVDESAVNEAFDQAAFEATVSWAINLVHKTPSPTLQAVEAKISSVKGPKTLALAETLGIGPRRELLSGVLAGRIQAPEKLLCMLATMFDSTVIVLAEHLRRSFFAAPAPSFKAEHGKPGIAARPIPWRDAVLSLELPSEETLRLLDFEKTT